jgi:Asp-tRNA(Asn)/Glu-tRNA(Gln) amidotransferase A subunit family amidase
MPYRLTVTQAAREIAAGRLSPVDLTEACLRQIDRLEPQLKAWVLVDHEGALARARRLQEELAAGKARGPLHGIPIGVKDIYHTKGMRTSGGSDILADFVPESDAEVVHRLRGAGCVILGKTVTTPFACFDPAETRNPWNPAHTPGGSSSGSAAGVSARMCPIALGSQTGGSISRPAAFCGLTGLKPTHGRVSLRNIMPVGFSLDHPGPIARSVVDAATLFQAMAGYDPLDPFCADVPTDDYVGAAHRPGPVSIGYVTTYFPQAADDAMRGAAESAARAFTEAGSPVSDVALPDSFTDVHQMHRVIMCAEGAAHHADQFASHRDEYPPGMTGLLDEGLALSAVQYADARRHQLILRREILQAFRSADILLTPATVTPAPRGLESTGDPAFNSPWSYTGLPTVVLPCGLSPDGLPTGIQLIGKPFGEAALLSAAAWCEGVLGWNGVPAVVDAG